MADPTIRQITALDLKGMLDSGRAFELMDVRTEEERAIAHIEGSRLLTRETLPDLMSLDRATPIVFVCHHGMRSQSAAEYCLSEGFHELYNVIGGIDAWSRDVDPKVPRY